MICDIVLLVYDVNPWHTKYVHVQTGIVMQAYRGR